MSKCVACKNNEGSMDFRVMEVRIIRSRDFAGRISKNQELCGMQDMSVCEHCIQEKLSEIRNPMKQFFPTLKFTIVLMIMGIFMVVRQVATPYTVVGAACVLVCIYKVIDFFKKTGAKKKSFEKYSENNARFVAAWECLSRNVPRRDTTSAMYYIPVTKATYKMTRDDFRKFYGLTNDNADEFFKLLHQDQISGDTPADDIQDSGSDVDPTVFTQPEN